MAGPTTIIAVHGVLTSNDDDHGLRIAVRAAVQAGARTIILNMADVPDVDSFGVAVLASSHMSALSRGATLMISNLSRKLRHLFAITRLDTVFAIYEEEADALADAETAE